MTTPGATSSEVAYNGIRSGITDAHHPRSGEIHYSPDLVHDPPNGSLITVRAMIWMLSLRNTTARLGVAFEREQRVYAWQGMTVRDDARHARTWFPVYFTAFVPPDAQPGDRVSVSLSNEGDLVYIDDLKVQWITAVFPLAAGGPGLRGYPDLRPPPRSPSDEKRGPDPHLPPRDAPPAPPVPPLPPPRPPPP